MSTVGRSNRSEVGGPRSEVGAGPRSTVGAARSEVGSPVSPTAAPRLGSEIGANRSEVGANRSEVGAPASAVGARSNVGGGSAVGARSAVGGASAVGARSAVGAGAGAGGSAVGGRYGGAGVKSDVGSNILEENTKDEWKPDTLHHDHAPGGGAGVVPEGSSDSDDAIHAPAGRRLSAMNIIENPLKRYSREKVMADAELFAKEHDMGEHVDMFAKAALVARDPHGFDAIPELNEEERRALQYEWDHKWHGSKMLWFSISLCAIGAATQGWDQTGSNGANLSWPTEFGVDNGTAADEWIVGAVNAIIFLTAGLIGAFLTDPLNHYFGRRGEIFICGACLTATPIASGFTHSWQALFAVRFVLGIGIGAKNATVPIFSAELAPARIRGALVMFWQLWVVAGIFLGFCANVIFKDVPNIAWRLQLGSAFLPAFILMCGIWFTPESPRWLMKHGYYAKGYRSFLKLRAHPIISARDYYYSYVIYKEELALTQHSNYFSRLWDCFSIPRIRRANYGASTVMIAQQMCGINIISFYSSTIFLNAGYDATQALYASLGYGAVQVVFTIPTLFLIDTVGRRRLCLITFPLMCIFLLAAGLSLLNTTGTKAAKIGPVVLFVYLFTIMYSLGEGPVAFQYSAEVFPTIQREQGMSWVVFINNFFAGVLSITFPRMQSVMTPTGAFGFYAGLNLIAWLMIFLFVRETKQLTLEELDQVFNVPTTEFVSYEAKVRVPWFFKRYFLFQKIPAPPPSIAQIDDTEYAEKKVRY